MVVKIHQHANSQAVPSMLCLANARKPQFWPVSLSKNSAKIWKINRESPYTDQSADRDNNLIGYESGQDASAG